MIELLLEEYLREWAPPCRCYPRAFYKDYKRNDVKAAATWTQLIAESNLELNPAWQVSGGQLPIHHRCTHSPVRPAAF